MEGGRVIFDSNKNENSLNANTYMLDMVRCMSISWCSCARHAHMIHAWSSACQHIEQVHECTFFLACRLLSKSYHLWKGYFLSFVFSSSFSFVVAIVRVPSADICVRLACIVYVAWTCIMHTMAVGRFSSHEVRFHSCHGQCSHFLVTCRAPCW